MARTPGLCHRQPDHGVAAAGHLVVDRLLRARHHRSCAGQCAAGHARRRAEPRPDHHLNPGTLNPGTLNPGTLNPRHLESGHPSLALNHRRRSDWLSYPNQRGPDLRFGRLRRHGEVRGANSFEAAHQEFRHRLLDRSARCPARSRRPTRRLESRRPSPNGIRGARSKGPVLGHRSSSHHRSPLAGARRAGASATSCRTRRSRRRGRARSH